jgi:hypothetical protein
MVTTIGIDPHKATHTAVAIDESETVLGELTVPADRAQTRTLLEWAQQVDGDGRTWAVEAAGGLGYLLAQQLVASGERVVDVPPVLASRVRVLGSGRSDKNDPNDALSGGGGCSPPAETGRGPVGRTTARFCRCWRNATSSSPVSAPRRSVGPCGVDPAQTGWNEPMALS